MNSVSHFQASLFNLNECHEKIENLYHQFSTHPETGSLYYLEPLLVDVSRYLILEVASFLDEYHIYFVQTKRGKKAAQIEAEYVQRIKDINSVLKPIEEAIYRWKGIEDYRDHFVAHTNRVGYNFNSLIIASQEPYDVPRKSWEFQLLRDLIHMMFGIISQEFKEELNDAWFAAKGRKGVMNPGKDNSKVDDELQNMIYEFEKECKQQGKEYTLNIPQVNYPPLKKMVENMTEFNHTLVHMHHLIRNDHDGIVSTAREKMKQKKKEPDKPVP